MPADVDLALFDAVTRLTRGHSRTTIAWLTTQVRRELKDARITAETIERAPATTPSSDLPVGCQPSRSVT